MKKIIQLSFVLLFVAGCQDKATDNETLKSKPSQEIAAFCGDMPTSIAQLMKKESKAAIIVSQLREVTRIDPNKQQNIIMLWFKLKRALKRNNELLKKQPTNEKTGKKRPYRILYRAVVCSVNSHYIVKSKSTLLYRLYY